MLEQLFATLSVSWICIGYMAAKAFTYRLANMHRLSYARSKKPAACGRFLSPKGTQQSYTSPNSALRLPLPKPQVPNYRVLGPLGLALARVKLLFCPTNPKIPRPSYFPALKLGPYKPLYRNPRSFLAR